ncbi:MAG: hypothetical protein ACFFFT_01295 [Candidatus Thorarchaeota archaeon]
MVIREAGLMLGGYFLVKRSYHKSTKVKIDKDLRSGLFTAILKFAETAFIRDSVEYIKGTKFIISFKYDKIKGLHSYKSEYLISYVIIDKEKRAEKYIHNIIQPLLEKVLVEFKSTYFQKNLSEVSQFKDFKKVLDRIFGTDTETVEQKLSAIFIKKKKNVKKKKTKKKQNKNKTNVTN